MAGRCEADSNLCLSSRDKGGVAVVVGGRQQVSGPGRQVAPLQPVHSRLPGTMAAVSSLPGGGGEQVALHGSLGLATDVSSRYRSHSTTGIRVSKAGFVG